jgi:hypothetical protein
MAVQNANFNQLSQTRRVGLSRHDGSPILEELNTHYGYYGTIKNLTREEYKKLMAQETYEGPEHPAETEFRNNRHYC